MFAQCALRIFLSCDLYYYIAHKIRDLINLSFLFRFVLYRDSDILAIVEE
jgi:hypothetical protein